MSPINIMKEIVRKCEKNRPKSINVMNLSQKYNIKHRRLYDLFNLLTALGVTRQVKRGKLAWVGLHTVTDVIESFLIKAEKEIKNSSMCSVFGLSDSPSLGKIAVHFMALFAFLNICTINIKKASALFCKKEADIKALEGRMYLTLGLLEMLKFISHDNRSGNYTVLINLSDIQNRARSEALKNSDSLDLDILLRKHPPHYINQIYANRLNMFEEFFNEFQRNKKKIIT